MEEEQSRHPYWDTHNSEAITSRSSLCRHDVLCSGTVKRSTKGLCRFRRGCWEMTLWR